MKKLLAEAKNKLGISNINIDCAVKRGLVPAVCGAFLGAILGNFLPGISAVVLLCIAASAILSAPRTGIVACFALVSLSGFLPHPSVFIFAVVILLILRTVFCNGKYIPCLLDLFVLCYGVLLVLSGVFGADSSSLFGAILYAVFLGGYFLFSFVAKKEDSQRAVNALIFSAVLAALVGVWQMFKGGFESGWLDSTAFSGIKVRIFATFDNPNVYATYLLLVIPFVLERAISHKKTTKRIVYFAILALFTLCMLQTWSRGAWLGLLLEIFVFLLLSAPRLLKHTVLGLPAAGVGAMLFFPQVIDRFKSIGDLSDTSVSYRISAWKGIAKMISANRFLGVGFGEPSFLAVYPLFAYSGATAVKHSHSLYLQILVETGALGLVLFLGAMVVLAKDCLKSVFARRQNCGIIAAGLSAVVGSLFMGLTDHIWYNSRVFMCFWLVVALTNFEMRKEIAFEN